MPDDPLFELPLEAEQIQKILPHRPPFLLIDRVVELEPGKIIRGIKCLSQNDPWFQGHFPGNPIMPGVMTIEAVAQTGAIVLMSMPEYRSKIAVLAGVPEFRFRRLLRPGDVMEIEVILESIRMGVGRASGKITVDGAIAAEGVIQFMFMDIPVQGATG